MATSAERQALKARVQKNLIERSLGRRVKEEDLRECEDGKIVTPKKLSCLEGLEKILWDAAKQGDYDTVLHMVTTDSGLNMDVLNENRESPLIAAASGGHSDICRLLCFGAPEEEGAEKDDDDEPLYVEEEEFKANVDVDAQDEYGRTALYIAAEKGFTDTVKVLLEAGADQWIPCCDQLQAGESGTLPLWIASFNDHEDTMLAILNGGLRKRMKDDNVDELGENELDERIDFYELDIPSTVPQEREDTPRWKKRG